MYLIPVDEINFLFQHRREVAINVPPEPEAMRPRHVAGYCQRKRTMYCHLLIINLRWIFDQLTSLLTKKNITQHRLEGGI